MKELGSSAAQQQFFSKSIFFVVIGAVDVGNYVQYPNFRIKYTLEQYTRLIISSLAAHLKVSPHVLKIKKKKKRFWIFFKRIMCRICIEQRLYSFDARKFMVAGLPVLGCMPTRRASMPNGECDMSADAAVLNYNQELKTMLNELKSEPQDFSFIYADTYKAMEHIIQQPATYGMDLLIPFINLASRWDLT